MGEVDVLVENQTRQPSTAKVMKVWKDSDTENLISHWESRRGLWDTFCKDCFAFSAAL